MVYGRELGTKKTHIIRVYKTCVIKTAATAAAVVAVAVVRNIKLNHGR